MYSGQGECVFGIHCFQDPFSTLCIVGVKMNNLPVVNFYLPYILRLLAYTLSLLIAQIQIKLFANYHPITISTVHSKSRKKKLQTTRQNQRACVDRLCNAHAMSGSFK